MKDIQKELAELAEQIDATKKKVATLEGREHELLKVLKEVLGTKDIGEAETKIKNLDKEQGKLEKEIEKSIETLREEYSW